ncbi:extracellular solute-binding protein, partial [mine drainage metagenome]
MAAVVMIVVIVVVGGVGYVGIGALAGQGSNTVSTCQPATSPVCRSTGNLNNVVLFVAYQPGYGQSMIQLQQGQTLPATVSLSGGGVASSYTVHWGDGKVTTQSSPTFKHTYTGLGVFVMHATANVSGVTHQGPGYLYPVQVIPSIANSASGQYPVLTTTFSNGSVGPTVSRPWIQVGQGPISVSGSYSSLPTAPGYVAGAPSITSTGGTQVSSNATSTQARATYSFSSAGVYRITFVGPITTPSGSTMYQNYTWTVFVGAAGTSLGCAYCQGKQSVSPHPGSIDAYEIAPGGATSLDPAVDYETVGAEVMNNIFETLVNYNGTSTAGFVPVLANCVPGTQQCTNEYGNSLVTLVNNQPIYWTFVISGNASFYDPATHASWGVYPSDVMFSITRTLLWLQTPSQYVYNGWIIGQSLLPYGNPNWDGGLHAPWNNTPQNILGSMLVNDSQFCPSAAMTNAHGCITFKAAGSGSDWPFFLQLVGDAN